MVFLKVKKTSLFISLLLYAANFCVNVEARSPEYSVEGMSKSFLQPYIKTLDSYSRHRRDLNTATSSVATDTTGQVNATEVSNRTTNETKSLTTAVVAVTQTPLLTSDGPPLLGVNGSGILKVKLTGNTAKVSDPLSPDDNFTNIYESPEKIKAEQNLTDLKYDNHSFYNSIFIGNRTYFNEYWTNITKPKADVHPVLSHSHRRATTLKLSFEFPFYGQPLRNVTVATGGFIYTGEHVHNWLAATQYIAPLMANFDTTLTEDSQVQMYDDGEKFTALWNSVTLQENKNQRFTFAVTLYKNGDIVFAYKDIPIPIQDINDTEHPVKVGISDAYLTDKILFYVRRKTIYEYHRVSFKNYEITNNTILKLIAQPTCLQYSTCEGCVNHDTGFNCSWCEQIQRCSSGTDRNKQDWMVRNCNKSPISEASQCPANGQKTVNEGANTTYITDVSNVRGQDTVVHTGVEKPQTSVEKGSGPMKSPVDDTVKSEESNSRVGGIVALLVTITLITSVAAWVLYAFKNPHTRSGQMLIKYRPSQWNWRRGEARYTAATIHM